MTWIDGSLLTWTRRGTRIVELDETMALMSDGTTWLWVLAAADDHRPDTVGTYRVALRDDPLTDARRLAAALASAGPEAPADHPFVVLCEGQAFARVLVPGAAAGHDAEALALFEDLARAALDRPLAAARVGVAVTGAAGTVAGASTVALMVASIGSEPVELRLDPDTFAVLLETPDGETRWEPLPRPAIGLVDVTASLLDGLHASATIPPGVTGALTVPLALGSGDTAALRARVGGSIRLRGPATEMDIPTERFIARTGGARVV